MKPRTMGKTLTLGDLIADVYHTCGKRRAKGILRLALSSRLVVFRRRNPYLLGGGNRKA